MKCTNAIVLRNAPDPLFKNGCNRSFSITGTPKNIKEINPNSPKSDHNYLSLPYLFNSKIFNNIIKNNTINDMYLNKFRWYIDECK